jgi:hypothetical protein
MSDIRDIKAMFKDRDFDDMLYPVHQIDKNDSIYPRFPKMAEMPSFVRFTEEGLPKSKVIRFIVYCYDRNSPIYKKYRNDDVKRKTTAAIYAGWEFDPTTGLFPKEVDDMLKGFRPKINIMIVDYIRQYNDPEYSILVAGYDSLYQKLQSLSAFRTNIRFDNSSEEGSFPDMNEELKNEELKGKLYDQCIKMGEKIEALASKILTDDNKYIKQDLYCAIDKEIKNKLNLSPEAMVGIK